MVMKKLVTIFAVIILFLLTFTMTASAYELLISKQAAVDDGKIIIVNTNVIGQSFMTLSNQVTIEKVSLYFYAASGTTVRFGLASTYSTDHNSWLYYQTITGTGVNKWWDTNVFNVAVSGNTRYYIFAKVDDVTGVVELSYDDENLYDVGDYQEGDSNIWRYDGDWGYFWVDDANFKVYGRENQAPLTPSFSTGEHTFCLNQVGGFAMNAWDPDEDEQLQYRVDWDDGGWGSWTDFTTEYNSGGYTKATKTIYNEWLTPFNGNLKVQSRDDDLTESPIYYWAINAYNHAPVLVYGDVDPNNGDSSTPFYFEVKYTDCDNDAPGAKWCYHHIQGYSWANEVMTAGSGTYQTGKWYSLGPRYYSYDGTGEYYFEFDDDEGHAVRLPSSGYYTFAVSTNNPPNTISSSDISFTPASFYRAEEVTFHASTTDPDGDTIRYGWSWNEDNTVNDWTGYYTSGTQCTQTHTYGYNDFDGVGGETLPVVVKVKADDGNGGVTDFTSKAISMLNHNPNSTTVYGVIEIANDTSSTWNLTTIDWETDQMWVKFAWGDGTNDTNTGWFASGSNVSASHTYTSRGIKTITCTITDEFAGTRVVYKTITVEDVPEPPTNIQSVAYNQKIYISWNKPNDDGGDPITGYGAKWWNASNSEDTADFIYEISYLNASEYDDTGHNLTGLDNAQQYNFRMSANNSYGMSSWSSIYNETPGHTPPTAPVMQPLSEYSGSVLDLEWSEPTFYDGAVISKYYILNSTDNVVYYALSNTTQRTYHVTGLINGETYYFRVYAVDNQSGQSPNSNYRWTFIDDINPTEPILNDLTIYTYGLSIDISWTASTDASSGIDYYVLQEDDSASFSSIINTYEGSSLNTTFSSNHVYSKTYYYRVRAYDKAGNPSEWNGPVQTTLRTNTTIGTEYSKVTEIWFDSNVIVINQPVTVTISVEDKYSIPTGYVHNIIGGVETEMRLSGIGSGIYRYNAIWQPASSGSTDFQIKVVNSNNAATVITVPINILTMNKTGVKPSVLVFETSDENIVVATFSEVSFNVSAYQDSTGTYHVTFGTAPDEIITVDLTELEPQLEPGYLWFIRAPWRDKYQLKCIVHGSRKVLQYKVDDGNYVIDGYNDWKTKWFGWLLGEDFVLVDKTVDYVVVSSINNIITVSY